MSEQDEKLVTTEILPVDLTQLVTFEREYTLHLRDFADVPCTTAEEAEWWTTWRNHTHEVLQERDVERKEVTGPMDKELKSINRWYREARGPAEQFKQLANDKLAAFALAQEQASKAAASAAQLAAETGDEDAVYEALASIPDVQKTDGNSVRMGWEVDSYDVAAMAKEPMGLMYLTLDTKSVERVLKAAGSQAHPPVIAGVTFKRVASSRPTGKRK